MNGRLRFDLADAPAETRAPARAARPAGPVLTESDRRDRDRDNILAALAAANGKVFGPGGAAELLDLKPTTLASRMKALGIQPERRRAALSGGAPLR
jgi:transcriptional regulator with GAF, ATPase, and Fis domain